MRQCLSPANIDFVTKMLTRKNMERHGLCWLLVLSVFIGDLTVDAAKNGPISYTKWTAACKLANSMRQIQNKAAHNVRAEVDSAEKYVRQMLRTKIKVEADQAGNYTPADTALLLYYSSKYDQAMAKLSEAHIANQATAIADAARLDGAINEFINMAGQLSDGSTKTCLAKDATNSGNRAATTPMAGDSAGCGPAPTPMTISNQLPAGFDSKGYTDNQLKTAASASDAKSNADCALTHGKNGNNIIDVASGGVNTAGDPQFAGGLFKWVTADLETRGTANMSDASATATTTMKRAFAAYKTATEANPTGYAIPTPQTLKADSDMKKHYKRYVLKTKESDNDPSNLESAIETTYKSGNELPSKYNKDFATTNVYNPNGQTPPKVPLTQLTTLEQLTKVLLHYQEINKQALRNKIDELEKQVNKESSKFPEKICNDIGENQTQCGETEGCHFVDTNEQGKKAAANQEENKAGVKDGETDFKCSKKKTEGECKDSSILVSKHFALSVVSAAFVALLF
uniref:Variant surface glycoprotein (VSG, atypical), putative n=1 Tax=Trypanosoma brucei brucei (strain 927/4 GUTat10.1) TaxID=185431 RepID=Q4FKS1_TRYB2|nr:variant surface glycoprotein (VSG, atypical), putative [Trypanosoma brucei brucei TREU927]